MAELHPDAVVNCAAWTDVDGAEADEAGAMAVNELGAGNLAAAAGRHGARIALHLLRLRLRRPEAHAVRRVRPPGALSAYGRSKAAGETATAFANDRHMVVRSSWLFGTRGGNFVETMLRLASEQPEVVVVSDQVGAPTYTRHLAAALAELIETDQYGIHHVAAAGAVLVVRLRAGDLRPRGRGLPRHGRDDRDARPPRPAAGLLGARLRAPRRARPARVARRSPPVPARTCQPWITTDTRCFRAKALRDMSKILVTGGAGFIGSAYVRHRLGGAHPGDEVRVLDKLTYAGRAREPRRASRAASWSRATSPTPTRSAGRSRAATRSSTSRRSRTSTARSSRPASSSRPTSSAPSSCSEAAREAGIRHLQISTDEVYGSIEEGSFTESSPLDPSSPYSASKAGGDLLVGAYQHTYGTESVIVRASNNYGPRQHPEKLIPLCILNALAGDPLPVYGDGQQVRNWLWVEDFASAIDIVLERGNPGEAYNVGGPDERANIDVVKEILKRARPRRVADRVRQGPPGPRPALLARLGEDAGPRLGGAGRRSKTGSPASSTGTARTRSGGSRSARASTASTTSASTAPS